MTVTTSEAVDGPTSVLRIVRRGDALFAARAGVEPPGTSMSIPTPRIALDRDRERETIARDLETLGMTESERDAFLRAWETELLGAPAPRAAPRIHHDDLLYWMPAAAIARIAALEATPAQTVIRRAILVRVDLSAEH